MKNTSPLQSLFMMPDNDLCFHNDQLAQVLKVPGKYICGMCGKQYPSLPLAWECVSNDTLKITSFPVSQINSHEECFYHCLLCTKSYLNPQDAALCTSNDLKRANLPAEVNEHLNSLVITTLKGQKITKREALNSRQHPFRRKMKSAKK